MIHVLFVCLGNICRSPMAEGVFRHLVAEAGLSDQITVDSAGTANYHVGESAHQGTLRVLSKHGIPYNESARQLQGADLDTFDYVLAMDKSNLEHIGQLAGDHRAQIDLFLSFANAANQTHLVEVPDPYYSGRFDEVYDLVSIGSRALLEHIRATHNL